MKTTKARLERLEARRPPPNGPDVIIICGVERGQDGRLWSKPGGYLSIKGKRIPEEDWKEDWTLCDCAGIPDDVPLQPPRESDA